MTELMKQHLNRANQHMKIQADKRRSERVFQEGDWVYLKLQPYVQSSVAVRANHKLAFRYFGPYQVEKKVGLVAYKLQLPPSATIHPVIHVSQLRKALPPSSITQPELPGRSEELRFPLKILQQRLRDKGVTATTQVQVQWSGTTTPASTWEDLADLQDRFPHAPAWGQAASEEGRSVMTPADYIPANNTPKELSEGRMGQRKRKANPRYATSDWAT